MATLWSDGFMRGSGDTDNRLVGDPDAQRDDECQKENQAGADQPKRSPAGLMSSRGLLEMPIEQGHVPVVRLPSHVEQITQQRNFSHDGIQSDVGHHPEQRGGWCAEPCGLKYDEDGKDGTNDVSDSGHQPDDGIDAEPIAGSRNTPRTVQQACQTPKPSNPRIGTRNLNRAI